MASLVPEPMEKWAVWAASPRRTMLPCRQVRLRTVVKRSHLELFGRRRWPSRWPARSSSQRRMLSSSLVPGGWSRLAYSSKPARRQAPSSSSTMKVERVAS